MNIVIAGIGKFGVELTEELVKENHNITIIDTEEEILDNVVNRYDVIGCGGNAASYDVQLEAGVDKADLFIATTSNDESNILCCLVAKKLGAKQTIARLRNPDYAKQTQIMQAELGVDFSINPDLDTAREIYRILRFPSANKVETFASGRVNLVEVKVTNETMLVGKTLIDIRNKFQVKILVCAVVRNNEVIIPNGNFELIENDIIYIAADITEMTASFKKLKLWKNSIKSTLIIGGSRISHYLTHDLMKAGISVKLIDRDRKTCDEFSEDFPKALVLYGDGTNNNILLEEGISEIDSLVALTGIDETNIIISSYAKSVGCEKVITKVNKDDYTNILETMGLDSVISPKEIFASNIIRYTRGMQNTLDSEFRTLHRLIGGKIEALEFFIAKETKYTGIALKDLKMRKNFLLACIIRANEVIIPGGNDKLLPNDSVVVITKDSKVKDLQDILE